jgi:hypothetical protein
MHERRRKGKQQIQVLVEKWDQLQCQLFDMFGDILDLVVRKAKRMYDMTNGVQISYSCVQVLLMLPAILYLYGPTARLLLESRIL